MIKHPIYFVILFYVVLLCIGNTIYANDSLTCIMANDFGLGGSIRIAANPDEERTDGKTKLILSEPKKSQVAPWIDTSLYTSPRNLNNKKLVGNIAGNWNPWGIGDSKSLQACKYRSCDPSSLNDAICLNGGQIVLDGIANSPCIVSDGQGLFGLIAILKDGKYEDPNSLQYALSLPPHLFRTFHVPPLKKGDPIQNDNDESGQPIQYNYYFEIQETQRCDKNSNCIVDIGADGNPGVIEGRLFFKILDRYYQDNTGGYQIHLVGGVYSDKGFIETTIDLFDKTIKLIVKKIYQSITKSFNFITIVRATLVLYVIFTAISFMLGVANFNQSEIIVRIFKVGLIATIISDTSWEFFNTYLFAYFQDGAKSIGSMIVKASLFNDDGSSIYALPQDASPLAVYDSLLRMLIQPPIHIKIVSLLGFNFLSYWYWVPCIYICIFFLLWAIFKSVILYLLILIQVGLLLAIAPIFLIMMLFKMTSELFNTWLKQLISTSMIYILIATSIALMMALITNQLTALLQYQVCWQIVKTIKILSITIFDIWFWSPQSESELLKSMNAMHFFALLLISFLFKAFIEQLPLLADVLSNAVRQPMSGMYNSAMSTYQKSFVGSIPAKLRALNPIGIWLDKGKIDKFVNVARLAANKVDQSLGASRFEDSVKTQVIKDYKNWLPENQDNANNIVAEDENANNNDANNADNQQNNNDANNADNQQNNNDANNADNQQNNNENRR